MQPSFCRGRSSTSKIPLDANSDRRLWVCQDFVAEHQDYARRRRRHDVYLRAKQWHCEPMVGHGGPGGTGNNDGKLSKAEMQALLGEVNGKALRKVSRLPNSGDDYASPVFGDGKIYVAGENGTVLVLADSPDGPVLAKNDMGDSIVATPASAEGRVLIRTRSKLFCIESNLP